MNCEYFKTNCLDYLDGNLDFSINYELAQHATECVSCASHLRYEELLRNTLSSLPVPEPRKGFSEDVFKHLDEEKPARLSSGFIAGFGSAIAASLIVWLVFAPAQMPSAPLESLNTISIAQNSINHIRLAFDAPANYQQVTLTLNLPEGTELNGFPGQSEISWQTSLKAGNNILTLPVIPRSNKGGVLSAKISGLKGSKTIKLKMNVTSNQPLPIEI